MTMFHKMALFFRNSLWLLLSCLIIEQLLYCLFVGGYWLQLLKSPVFWGMESVFCFWCLYKLNLGFPLMGTVQDDADYIDEIFGDIDRDYRWYPLYDPDTGQPNSLNSDTYYHTYHSAL